MRKQANVAISRFKGSGGVLDFLLTRRLRSGNIARAIRAVSPAQEPFRQVHRPED